LGLYYKIKRCGIILKGDFIINKKNNSTYSNEPIFLAKIQDEKFAYDLFENGHLYINNMEYFMKNENNSRYDENEGVYSHANNITLKFYDKNNSIKLRGANVKNRRKDFSKCPLYCMSIVNGYNFKNNTIYLDKKFKSLGDHMVLIPYDIFLNKLKKEVYKQEYKIHFGMVNYVNDNYRKHNFMPSNNKKKFSEVFEKDSEYSFQNEYRIFFEFNNTQSDHIDLYLGSFQGEGFIFPFK
jgi:hypothetical protein